MAELDRESMILCCPHCEKLLLWRDNKHMLYDAYHRKTLCEWITEELEYSKKGETKWDARKKGRSNTNLKKGD